MQNIFVYGTLMSEPVLNKLTGKSFQSKPAILTGYKRYCVRECDYPAIINDADSETKGLVIFNVEDSDLEVFSFYEGDEYEKKWVEVIVNGEISRVVAFIWKKDRKLLEDKSWDLIRFENNSLEHYLNFVIPVTLKEFRKE
jgi:gamma-glutamylcyclotransferase (GGCT)/AIG2-like uncharacterized protein YtfP